MEEFLTIAGAATSEFTEKKSRFVSDIFPVQTEDDVKACLEAGMNSHVGKPLDMQVLAAEISRQVRRYASLREGANFTKLGS